MSEGIGSAPVVAGMSEIERFAQSAASQLLEVAQLAATLQQLRLRPDHAVELRVQLLERLREVHDRLGEVDLVSGGGGVLCIGGLAPGHHAGVEGRIDMHESSPLRSGPGADTPDVPASTVAETTDTSSPRVGVAAEVVQPATSAAPLPDPDEAQVELMLAQVRKLDAQTESIQAATEQTRVYTEQLRAESDRVPVFGADAIAMRDELAAKHPFVVAEIRNEDGPGFVGNWALYDLGGNQLPIGLSPELARALRNHIGPFARIGGD